MEELIWGRRIRAFRKLKGFTQEDFAKRIGISVSVLGEIERGNRKPSEDLLKAVTETLQISLDELTSIN
ncbi:transcriptional regulator with XRE-family HTH domain [Evansella vedderi]|uniref:Transcriptional regulator with XRE-family HTH domain n=1 Tax=Evansella vedderi TaxID=38282 RepID=A0ABU0A6C8_9BACI|nr:helix-turn-helix transcriptional regulator [Evansella vedderi]MDQ0257890.1 transcriptional regulator with XRE-family HTH domain [Evansella vedderi]